VDVNAWRLALIPIMALLASPTLAGTIRFDNLIREIEWCEEDGETLRYGVQGIVYRLPRKDVEVIGIVCRQVEPPQRTSLPMASDFPFTGYLRQLKARVDARWRPPRNADSRLAATILFEIGRDGRIIGDPLVEATSGTPLFDEAALRAVRNSSPFAPLPADFKARSLRVHIRFDSAR
jgi:TonB family protein